MVREGLQDRPGNYKHAVRELAGQERERKLLNQKYGERKIYVYSNCVIVF